MEKEHKPIQVNHIFRSDGLASDEMAALQAEFDQDFLRYLARLLRDNRTNSKAAGQEKAALYQAEATPESRQRKAVCG